MSNLTENVNIYSILEFYLRFTGVGFAPPHTPVATYFTLKFKFQVKSSEPPPPQLQMLLYVPE
jgi:hypothetical protein